MGAQDFQDGAMISVACHRCGEVYKRVPVQDGLIIDTDAIRAQTQHLLKCAHNGPNREFAAARAKLISRKRQIRLDPDA